MGPGLSLNYLSELNSNVKEGKMSDLWLEIILIILVVFLPLSLVLIDKLKRRKSQKNDAQEIDGQRNKK